MDITCGLVAIVDTAGSVEIGIVEVGSVVEVVGGIDGSLFAGSEQLTAKLDQLKVSVYDFEGLPFTCFSQLQSPKQIHYLNKIVPNDVTVT